MAFNAAHGGARAGSGRPRSGPANSAPGFAASGKRQRTLDGLLGFQSQRSSNTQQVADADGEESGASDSHAGMAMDASSAEPVVGATLPCADDDQPDRRRGLQASWHGSS